MREGFALFAGIAPDVIKAAARESEALARQVDSTEGVVFVPALTGLGSPHWDPEARGLVSGITRGTTRAHLARAALEAIAFQVADVLDACPGEVAQLRVDGGASRNSFLMQFQADLLGTPVDVAADMDTTALGAAALAGLAVEIWPDAAALRAFPRTGGHYEPTMSRDEVESRKLAWQVALRRTRSAS